MPKRKPEIVDVPAMNFIAVRGVGNPNEKDGAYQQAISILYTLAFTIRMSAKAGHEIEGFLIMSCRRWRASGGRREYRYLKENGYVTDITDTRLHHEIYLSDARRVEPARWRTVIRHPVKKREELNADKPTV